MLTFVIKSALQVKKNAAKAMRNEPWWIRQIVLNYFNTI